MSNKILDTETFDIMWEKIKMIKAFVFAEEKGYERGVTEGRKEGILENTKKMRKDNEEKTNTSY